MLFTPSSENMVSCSTLCYAGVYFTLCLVYIAVGIRSCNRVVRVLLKCSPIVLLIVTCAANLQKFGRGPVGHTDLTKRFECVLFGLIFSCIGDFYLIFDGLFIHGIASFAIAQMVYIYLFHGHMLISQSTYYEGLITAGVAMVSISVYLYLLPKLSRILAVSLLGYCTLISIMLWSSLAQMLRCHNASTIVGAVGASMFYTSDLLLGVNRWRIKMPFGPELVMITYYIAQFLITWSQIMFLWGHFLCII